MYMRKYKTVIVNSKLINKENEIEESKILYRRENRKKNI